MAVLNLFNLKCNFFQEVGRDLYPIPDELVYEYVTANINNLYDSWIFNLPTILDYGPKSTFNKMPF